MRPVTVCIKLEGAENKRKHRQMYTLKDDPLARAVSLFGRVTDDRVHKYPGSLRRPRESLENPSTLSARLKNTSPVDTLQGMDIWRGIYMFTQVNHVTIDSLVFRLHSNATVILLVTFSIAVTTRQYVGNPIECVHTRDIPEDVLNTYCWIHSTYTVIDAFMKTPGSQVAYPGVETSVQRMPAGKSSTKQVRYYQWVAFMLFFQIMSLLGTCSVCSISLDSLELPKTFPLRPPSLRDSVKQNATCTAPGQ
ncbi:hypothetical protein Trydic_g1618 [Trypoxylus dichotomus]